MSDYKAKRAKAANVKEQGIEKKWYLIGGGALAAVILVTVLLIMYYIEPDRVVARVNGINVHASDISHQIRQAENVLAEEYFAMFPDDWEIDYDRIFRDGITFGRAIREEAVRFVAIRFIYEEYARELGITISEDEMWMISDHIDSLEMEFGRQELNDMLVGDGIRGREHLTTIFESQQLLENLIEEIAATPELSARYEHLMPPEPEQDWDLLAAKHILISFNSFETEEEAQELAAALLPRVQAGEDFDMLITEYGDDPGMEGNPNGYTFVSGVMVPEFEIATMALEIGEISGLVRSDFGYHIIMRTEPVPEEAMLPFGEEPLTPEQRIAEAVLTAIETMAYEADIVFLPALDNVSIERPMA